ncbi:MAG: SUMF1/EgtB/PvdO family nonheme iron enzyme [Planctomycetes bacterium]|nr:SUMF1/EgtB/PvdO family nonheme iron enzyme [Planctomycetota bacterium]
MTDDELIGKRIGNYLVERKIGEGAMGAVYKAYQVNLQRTVALKLLPPTYKNNKSLLERFRREAMAAARLEDRHIVQVYDILEEGGETIIVMQFVEGRSVESLLKERGPLSVLKAVTICVAALKGLARAHQKGILHRDIKPGNILLSKEGEVKIADFGLARIGNDQPSVTQAGQVMGTPYYMSPEQCMGDRPIDKRSDLYAVGVTLYEMLTGKVPFHGSSTYVVMRQHVDEDIPSPTTADRTVPEEVCRVLAKLTARSLDERYATAEEAIKDLDKWRKTAPQEDSAAKVDTRRRQKTGLVTKAYRRERPKSQPTPAPAGDMTITDALAPLQTPNPSPGDTDSSEATLADASFGTGPLPAIAARAGQGGGSEPSSHRAMPASRPNYAVPLLVAIGILAAACGAWLAITYVPRTPQRGPTGPPVPAVPDKPVPHEEDVTLLVSSAKKFIELGAPDQAAEILTEAIKKNPNHPGISQLLQDALAQKDAKERRKQVGEWGLKGRKAILDQEWDQAVRCFEQMANLADQAGASAEARLGVAEAQARKLEAAKDLKGAIATARAALSADHGEAGAATDALRRELARMEAAARQAEDSRVRQDTLADRVEKGRAAEKEGRWGDALDAYTDALALAGDDPALRKDLERCAARKTETEGEDARIRKLVEQAAHAREKSDLAAASAFVKEALGIRPDDPRALAEQAAIREHRNTGLVTVEEKTRKGDWAGAYDLLKGILRTDPGNVEALKLLKKVALNLLPEGFGSVGGTPADPVTGLPLRILCKRDNSIMVLVAAGKSIMGADRERPEERPPHDVELGDYYIDVAEITNEQYYLFLKFTKNEGHGACPPQEGDGKDHTPKLWFNSKFNELKLPVAGVDWFDAAAYAAWTGRRLPTEAEWEKAASWDPLKGSHRKYPWGAEWDRSRCNSGARWAGKDLDGPQQKAFWEGEWVKTSPLAATLPSTTFGTLGVSFYGCSDMAGNLWEWCQDGYDPEAYKAAGPFVNPRGPDAASQRVVRGGCWRDSAGSLRTSLRAGADPRSGGDYSPYVGFRCVLLLGEKRGGR